MDIFKKRFALLKETLDKEGVSSFLISNNIHCEYFSGLRSSNQFLLFKKEKCYLFTDFRYRQLAQEVAKERGFVFVELGAEGIGEALTEILSPGDSMAVESDDLTVDLFDKISVKLNDVNVKKYAGLVSQWVAQKSEGEFSKIQRASEIGDKAFSLFVNDVVEEMSEIEAAKVLEGHCRDLGSEGPSFSTIVLFGERSALPHGVPTNRKLKEGDYILCDFGCIIDGYCSDMTRTLIFNNKSEMQDKIYHIVNTARDKAVKAVKAGVKASDIDKVARDIITSEGYGDMFGHGTGHGVGREVHEFPAVNSRNDTILKDGMIITIEPGIYIPDHGGVRIEDMVLVKEDGAQLITSFTRDLIVIKEGSEI